MSTVRSQAALQETANRAASSGQDPTMNTEFQARFLNLVQNEFLSRGAFIQRWMDPRRDLNKECGYPETYEITSEKWQDYYERHPIAARVVELFPSECWQITPDVYESDDPNETTPFEQGLKELAVSLRGSNSFYRPEEEVVHPLWEFCKRADILSGIGQFGVMLLGFDDGKSLNQPVDGWVEPEAGNITWNEEALPFIHENISQYIELGPYGELIWNAPPEEEEEKPKDKKKSTKVNIKQDRTLDKTEGNGKPIKKVTDKENMQSSDAPYVSKSPLPPEPTESDPNAPSPTAFGNQGIQQSKYRDPMDVHGQDNIVDQGTQQPEYGAFETHDPEQAQQPQQGQRKLLYIRIFPESLVQIMRYEQNMASPRFGQPVLYRITLNDPMQNQTGVGLPLSTVEVHYSRVIHLADVGANSGSSEIFAAPRMRPVLNSLIDLAKIYGACGEGYWKAAFATLVAETHPQLGGDVTLDVEAMRSQMKKWRDSLDRVLAATGVTWKTLAPSLIDPNSFVQNHLNAICIKLGVPLRVFMGTEQGVLAGTQDAVAWSFRVKERRKNYLAPRLIVPLIDRLILVGVLPQPETYSIDWNDDQKLMPQEQASIAGAITGAMATYISGQVDQLIEPISWLTEVVGWDRDKAKSVVDATMEHIMKQQEAQAQQGQQMIDPTTGQPMEQDEQGQFIDPNTGEPLQTDEMGNPVMIDPQTGQPMPVQQQSPQEQQGPLGAEATEAAQGMDPSMGLAPGMEQEPGMDPGVDPETGESLQEEQSQGEVDEETGLEIDPETGYLIDPESGLLVDKETGDVYDPQSGEAIGNVNDQQEEGNEELDEAGNPIQPERLPTELDQEDDEQVAQLPQQGEQYPEEEQAGLQGEGDETTEDAVQGETDEDQAGDASFPIDPETGYLVNPQGYQLDQETGDIYSPDGQLYGNINDGNDEEEDG